MAQGISTAISIVDGLTPSLRTMTESLNRTITAFDRLHQTANRPMNLDVNLNQATVSQNNLNNAARTGTGIFASLKNQVMGLVGAYLSFQTASTTIRIADEITNINSRLDLMKDSMNTVDTLQKKIMKSANNTFASYKETADMVGKLGTLAGESFSNNDDIINFAEQINKLFTIAGTSTTGKSAAMLQLTQALASGTLRGEEFNSILENAPTIAGAIAKALNVNTGELRKMASEGKLTADVVKNSIYKMADETNAKFDQMALTFGDVWNVFKNKVTDAFMPLFEYLREVGNSKAFQGFMSGVASSMSVVASLVVGIFKAVGSVGSFIANNWKTVAPLIFGALAPLLAFKTALALVWAWQKIVAGAQLIWSGITFVISATNVVIGLFNGQMAAASAATFLFNSVWLASPVTWVILGIVAAIGVAVGMVFYFADSWQDAVGIITGALSVLGTFFMNIFKYIYNIIASVVEFFANVWTNPIYSVKKLFVNLATNVLDLTISMMRGWDKFATNMVNAMITAINGIFKAWNKLVEMLPDTVKTKLGIESATMIGKRESITSDIEGLKKGIQNLAGKKPENYWEAPKLEFKDLSAIYNAGRKWGTTKANDLSVMFDTKALVKNLSSEDLLKNAGMGNGANGKLGEIADNTKATAKNTGNYEEELKYMRDIAEREAINRFTTAEIKIGMTNNNNINSEMDIDGVINILTDKLYESMSVAAEGSHF